MVAFCIGTCQNPVVFPGFLSCPNSDCHIENLVQIRYVPVEIWISTPKTRKLVPILHDKVGETILYLGHFLLFSLEFMEIRFISLKHFGGKSDHSHMKGGDLP